MIRFGDLYHWSPAERRAQIIRRGLATGRSSVTHSDDFRAPYVCLSPSPLRAWVLSGDIVGAVGQTWDLWQVRLDDSDDVRLRPDWGPEIMEIRVHNRIPRGRVWRVAERTIAPGDPRRRARWC